MRVGVGSVDFHSGKACRKHHFRRPNKASTSCRISSLFKGLLGVPRTGTPDGGRRGSPPVDSKSDGCLVVKLPPRQAFRPAAPPVTSQAKTFLVLGEIGTKLQGRELSFL